VRKSTAGSKELKIPATTNRKSRHHFNKRGILKRKGVSMAFAEGKSFRGTGRPETRPGANEGKGEGLTDFQNFDTKRANPDQKCENALQPVAGGSLLYSG